MNNQAAPCIGGLYESLSLDYQEPDNSIFVLMNHWSVISTRKHNSYTFHILRFVVVKLEGPLTCTDLDEPGFPFLFQMLI